VSKFDYDERNLIELCLASPNFPGGGGWVEKSVCVKHLPCFEMTDD